MTEIWRASVPGHTAHTVLADPATGSLFVSDGWGVAYAALRLHRLDPATGESLAEIRTRQQHVSALAIAGDSLFVATHSRLLELRPEDLTVIRHWDRVLPSDSQQLVACDGWLVAANRRKPAIGLFHPATSASARLRVGLQPLLCVHEGTVKVVEGFEGGVRALDLENRRLLGTEPGPAVAAVAAGADLWGIEAGPPPTAEDRGAPSSWLKPGLDRLVRIGADDARAAWLPEAGSAAFCDDGRGLVWCLVGPENSVLVAVSQEERRMVASFPAGTGRYWSYFDPVGGLAVAAETVDGGAGYRPSQSVSALTGHLVAED